MLLSAQILGEQFGDDFVAGQPRWSRNISSIYVLFSYPLCRKST